ncbi:hypothetical protein BDP27DRAFT_1361153 [Rhodocollybia butyracea]|uniref:Uncharacterized protein n=1 Tax=Rhodocollybia butyracea TaxID=206335 RepID=A0A9P5Q1K5_9AGAR|nr:hypothetical protein BDP27DRAFT_1361153 [Rhodocollybia butyracea]
MGKSGTSHSTSAIPPPPSPDVNAPETPAPAGQTMTMSINFEHGVDKTKAQTPEVQKYVTAVQRGEMRWAVEGLHTAIDERRAKGTPFDKIQPGYKPVFKWANAPPFVQSPEDITFARTLTGTLPDSSAYTLRQCQIIPGEIFSEIIAVITYLFR